MHVSEGVYNNMTAMSITLQFIHGVQEFENIDKDWMRNMKKEQEDWAGGDEKIRDRERVNGKVKGGEEKFVYAKDDKRKKRY